MTFTETAEESGTSRILIGFTVDRSARKRARTRSRQPTGAREGMGARQAPAPSAKRPSGRRPVTAGALRMAEVAGRIDRDTRRLASRSRPTAVGRPIRGERASDKMRLVW